MKYSLAKPSSTIELNYSIYWLSINHMKNYYLLLLRDVIILDTNKNKVYMNDCVDNLFIDPNKLHFSTFFAF